MNRYDEDDSSYRSCARCLQPMANDIRGEICRMCEHLPYDPAFPHYMPTQEFIDRLARLDPSPCERHGDVMRCKPLRGYSGRAWQVTFEDTTSRCYVLNSDGKPTTQENT